MEGSITPPRFVTLATSSLQIRIKTPNISRSPSRSPVRSGGFVRSSSARYSRKDDIDAGYDSELQKLLAPPTSSFTRPPGRTGTRSLSPRPDRVSGYSGPPPPSPNSGARFGTGFPLLPTRAPTPPQSISRSVSEPEHKEEDQTECDRTSETLRTVSSNLSQISSANGSNGPTKMTSLHVSLSRRKTETGSARPISPSPNKLGPTLSKQTSLSPNRGRADAPATEKVRPISPSPNRLGVTKSASHQTSLSPNRGRPTASGAQPRSLSPSPCRLGAVSPSTFATSFSKHVTSPSFLGKVARENNNNNNTIVKSNGSSNNNTKDRIVRPAFQLTPPCGRKFGTATMSAERSGSPDQVNKNSQHSAFAGTLLTAAATTASFFENNNNNNSKNPMTPPALRKFGTVSPAPQTLSPTDPLLSYPFCPYKVEPEQISGRTKTGLKTLHKSSP